MAETMDTYGQLFPDAEDLGRTAVDQAPRPLWRNRNGTGARSEREAAGQRPGGRRASL
jgi:hypothetical protein